MTQETLNKLSPTITNDLLNEEEYNMNHPNRGHAIIFNHENFATCTKRRGTNKDREDLIKCLKLLKFDVEDCQDYTYSEIMDTIKWATQQNHTDNDCLLIAILSHGSDEEYIYAKDKKYKFDDIWNPFTPDKCPTLAGKPKLFLLQACRGGQMEDRILIKRTQTDTAPVKTIYRIPLYADFLLSYATMPNYCSMRNTQSGSWFIQSLCSELTNWYREYDLLTILTFVCQRVAIYYETQNMENEKNNNKKQIPCLNSMLTKILYFGDKSN